MKRQLNVRIEDSSREKLKDIAERDFLDFSAMVRSILDKFIANDEKKNKMNVDKATTLQSLVSMTEQMTIRIEKGLFIKLTEQAINENRSRSKMAEQIFSEHFKQKEKEEK